MILIHFYLAPLDTQSKVQYQFLTNFIISMLPNFVQTMYILEGKHVICTFLDDKTKSIQFLHTQIRKNEETFHSRKMFQQNVHS